MAAVHGDCCSSSDSESESQASNTKDYTGSSQIPSTPLLSQSCTLKEGMTVIPHSPSTQAFRLSDAVSVLSGEEITQRREALRLFSSNMSMSSSLHRSCTPMPGVGISYELTPFSSTLSSLSPLCRICQCPADTGNVLISPCRCDGSLKHIHGTCLRRWIEVSEKKHKYSGPAFCELCGYIYRKHKFFKCRDWKWPKIALRDKILHTLFLVTFFLMIGCAIATVMCFTTDKDELAKYKEQEVVNRPLTREEVITICCGITFFVSFFVAMSAELKSKHAIHHIIRRCIRHNTVWFIENYSVTHDHELKLGNAKLAVSSHQD